MTPEFRKDLSHLTWENVFWRQQQRAALIPAWLDALHLRQGSHVLDLGAGPGYGSLQMALRVGPTGLVYAVDRERGALAYLATMMRRQQVTNIRRIIADAHALDREGIHVTSALLSMMLHHSDNPAALIGKLTSLLPPDGLAVIAEFHPDGPVHSGPPREARLSPELLEHWCNQAGFQVVDVVRQSEEHYMLTVQRSRA